MLRLCTLMAAALGLAAPASAAPAFRSWTAAVVAGDWRASGGEPTDAFENTRQAVAAALKRLGFLPTNIRQFSPNPDLPGVLETSETTFARALMKTTGQAKGGCLIYISTHGVPQGVVFGRNDFLTPADLDLMLDLACGARPTVAIVSACFSGVFVPALAAPNRVIITAARPDRSSFGCGVDERYPYFDECVLSALPKTANFADLGTAARSCVAAREKRERLSPPSEPQLSVGADIAPLLPRLSLRP